MSWFKDPRPLLLTNRHNEFINLKIHLSTGSNQILISMVEMVLISNTNFYLVNITVINEVFLL